MAAAPKHVTASTRLGRGTIEQPVWSPDGSTLAVAGSQGVWLYSASDWQQPPRLLESLERYQAIAFSPDNHTIAACTDLSDSHIDLWDSRTGEKTARFTASKYEVWTLAFNADGTLLASGDTSGEICVWDMTTQTEKIRLQHPADYQLPNGNPINHLLFLPDKSQLVASHFFGPVRVWNLDNVRVITVWEDFAEGALITAFVRDQLIVVSSFDERDLRLRWLSPDVESPYAIHTPEEWENLQHVEPGIPADLVFTGYTDTILDAVFTPDHTRLIAADLDNVLRIWNLETRALEAMLPASTYHRCNGLALHPNGEVVASMGEDARIRIIPLSNPAQQHVIEGHTPWVSHIALSPDETLLASGSIWGDICLWNLRTGHTTPLPGSRSHVSRLIFDRHHDTLLSSSSDGSVRLWDVKTASQKAVFKENVGSFWTMSLSPSGQWVAVGGQHTPIIVWDTQSGEKHAALLGHTRLVRWVQFLSDDVLLSASDDGRVGLWDIHGGAALVTLGTEATNYGECKSVALSPDHKLLANSFLLSKNPAVTIWNLETHMPWITIPMPQELPEDMAFSPDGAYLLMAGMSRIVLCRFGRTLDVHEFYHLDAPREHMRGASAVAFHPGGKLFAAAGRHGIIRLWHVETHEEIAVLPGHTFGIRELCFSADGSTLISAALDGTIRLWNLSEVV